MLNLASGTVDVSRANWIAMLVMDISIGKGIDILVDTY